MQIGSSSFLGSKSDELSVSICKSVLQQNRSTLLCTSKLVPPELPLYRANQFAGHVFCFILLCTISRKVESHQKSVINLIDSIPPGSPKLETFTQPERIVLIAVATAFGDRKKIPQKTRAVCFRIAFASDKRETNSREVYSSIRQWRCQVPV